MWEHGGEGGMLHWEVRIPYKAVCVTQRGGGAAVSRVE